MITTQFSKYLPESTLNLLVHIGAHVGGEAKKYEEAGFKCIVWIEADPDLFSRLCQNLESRTLARHIPHLALITRESGGGTCFSPFFQ